MSNETAEHKPSLFRKYSVGVATCLVALLALLALEDITTGVQPSFVLEWLMVAFASGWFLAVGALTLKRRQI
jgi:hypothetical protein